MVSLHQPALSTPSRLRLFASAVRYLVGKALTIFVTIFVGVFITMLIVNYPSGRIDPPDSPFAEGRMESLGSPFAARLEAQIEAVIRRSLYLGTFPYDPSGDPIELQIEAYRQTIRKEAGLTLPFLPRNLLWTVKALTFDWGELDTAVVHVFGTGISSVSELPENGVLEHLPNTLLLVGTSYLLVFLIGLPLALYLARNHGSRLDRVVTILSPISSVPSWVFAVLLVALFAVQLRLLPVSGMYDAFKPPEAAKSALELVKHMILPVSALVISLLFQLVYAWRTFFIIYSEEDYVELARAKGLSNRVLERQYILKPALPFIITSFTTSLIGFWQLTVALEKIFDWPGIGLLYIEALPNYWKESVEIGDLMIVIQIVVIFAYLLGILVFILDLIYVIVDPRIHLAPSGAPAQKNVRLKRKTREKDLSMRDQMKNRGPGLPQPVLGPVSKRGFSASEAFHSMGESLHELNAHSRLFFQELRRYPSAVFGLSVIIVLLAGSLYAVLALPYEEFGREFDENRVSGRNSAPRVAAPVWFNYFSATPRLSALIMDETSPGAVVSTRILDNGWTEKTIAFDFEYNYRDFPSDVFLYLDPSYAEKFPFVSLTWTAPDGRTLDLKATAVEADLNYDFEEGIPARKLLNQNPAWQEWFVTDGQYPTPIYQLLFAEPGAARGIPQRGSYQLKITSLFFEENNDLNPQLVLLGQVYGLAGTDYWRRDLVIPLFWGMPFALFIGLLGTFITTMIAMVLPAMGVWYGGWFDNLIQRLTEVNMVLPGLALAVLANLLFGTDVWIVLGIVVLLNAFGSPIKSFRSAFLQAKEAPYIEMARSYGASDFRIITRYLVPRIMPVFIPQLVTQIPGFIFLEATLGFFNINSDYPSWGRIIYDGLSRGALYGSPFWVMQPIFLLLLTGLAFAMLGSALERILNPRVIADVSSAPTQPQAGTSDSRRLTSATLKRKIAISSTVALLAFIVFVPVIQGQTLAGVIIGYFDETRKISPIIPKSSATVAAISTPSLASLPASAPGAQTVTITPSAAIETTPTSADIPASTDVPTQGTPSLAPGIVPSLYTLQRGEYPYCIADRFNVDPVELLALSGLSSGETYYAGTILTIPQSGKPFPGERMRQAHPAVYIVSSSGETIYSIACRFGDVDPLAIAGVNNLPVESALTVGQQLDIP